jgi:hypothetical protein
MKMLTMLVAVLLAGCESMGLSMPAAPDQLQMVVQAATLRVQRSTQMVIKKQLPADQAMTRLDRAEKAQKAMQEAMTVIATCEGKGGCNVASVRRELALSALDQLESYLIQAGEVDAAEAAGAARIVAQMMSSSAAPASGSPQYSATFGPMVANYTAAVAAFRRAVVP